MKGNPQDKEVRLLEELMKDKEVIFRQEISDLKTQVDNLKQKLYKTHQ